jgi:hypothetical protein
MQTESRIQQIIVHQESVRRSLVPFGLAVVGIAVAIVVFAL